MKHVTPAAARKTAAVAAYDAALVTPGADWRAVAEQLREFVTAPKAKAAAATGFAPWADRPPTPYKPAKKNWPFVVYETTFVDGQFVRMTQLEEPKKPRNVAKAVRIAATVYRRRTGLNAVPPIAALTNETTGETWNATDVNRRTRETRAGVDLALAA